MWDHTWRYLSPDTGEHASPQLEPCKPVLDLPTLEGEEPELALMLVMYRDGLSDRRQ